RSTAREALQAHLKAAGVETLIHYPVAIPKQPALHGISVTACPIAERVSGEVLSLPLHPALPEAAVDQIAAAVHTFRA
ncbi:MAG: DegT/DnrJ/EryC1/StrS family aminotransferase, partial [Acidobacteria bacterium]|nr:DegT/DnrJ/EryC1/StrS family aminotransferase [Acidobacteriota bacterium]